MLSTLELKRKAWHILAGLGLVGLVYFDLVGVLGIMGLLLVFIVIKIIYQKRMSRLMGWVVESLERKDDIKKNPVGGVIHFLMGSLVAGVIFPKDIFLAGLVILVLGDAISPLVGQFGKFQYFYNKEKTWEGIITGIIAAGLGAMVFVSWYEAWMAAVIAMFLEGLDLKVFGWEIDDNLMIPIVAGAVILALRILV